MPPRGSERKRLLATVLFTDIVDSTRLATELGDARWRRLLARHHTIMRRELKRHRGREIDTAGDGFFATFEQPSDAIDCAEAMIARLRHIGVEIRTGVHMGEVETSGSEVSGIAVHVGARVMSKAAAGQVLISGTVRELLSGSDRRFDDAGVHELKGIGSRLHLFAVQSSAPPEIEADEVDLERPWRRRAPWLAAVVAGALAAVVITVFVLSPEPEGSAFVPAANTVAQLDPSTGELVGGVHVGTTPTVLAFGDGLLWVANFDDKTVQSVDVAEGTVSAAKGGVLANPTGIAVGGGLVWITNGFAGQLVKLDPSQPNDVVPIEVGAGAQGVAYGFDHVWVAQANQGTLLRVDPLTDEIHEVELPSDADPVDVAVDGDSVWVADGLGGRVLGVDPEALAVTRTVTLRQTHPTRIATGGGFVWATSVESNSLTRVDPASGQTTTVPDIGNGPLGVAADDLGVWVANSRDGTVARVDPRSAKVVDSARLGFSPDGVAITPDGVWVSLHDL